VCMVRNWCSYIARLQGAQGLVEANSNKWETYWGPEQDPSLPWAPPTYRSDHPSLQHANIMKPIAGPSHFQSEDRDSAFIWNIGISLQVYTVSQPRTQSELILNVSHQTCTHAAVPGSYFPPLLSFCHPSPPIRGHDKVNRQYSPSNSYE
jgi:hypothetical protein